ncbi:uncharacterized protein [Montipora capricornis]|uniref:uncharacterized protein n=1 Tax=Montipora capricornis TaxID=246305 RepID=UPI0035F1673B
MSLAPKIDEIGYTLNSTNTDIAFFSETWLKETVPDDPIKIKGYQLFGRDRKNRDHGGVCLCAKNSIQCMILPDLHSDNHEVLWVELRPNRLPRGFSNIIAAVIYHPPDANNAAKRDYLRSSLTTVESKYPNSVTILAGDFNKLYFTSTAKSFQIKPIIDFPTRGANTFDQMIFTNIAEYYSSPLSAPPFDILAFPIADILNTSFLECKVPRVWKLADAPPLPKVPTISDFIKDLRIFNHLCPYIDAPPLTANGSTVRTALLDYRKAFDLVDHHLLIAKLFSVGVKPTTVNWIIDFLRDRQQRVKLNNNCYFSWLNVPARVRQGTRLGPWLFLVMINDLKLPGESFSMWKFAEDTTVSEVVPSSGESSLQEAVNHISSWSHSNLFQLNPTKCKELVVCFKKTPPSYGPIKIYGEKFERVSSAKVLGVTISNDLKRNDHVDTITSKAARRLYLLSQLKRAGIGPDYLLAFHYSVIRLVLEFSCQLFHRSLPKYLSDDIERIQRRAM